MRWQVTIRNYLLASAVAHLTWEIVQLPLYTIWSEGTLGEQVFAILHCTGGDVIIAGMSLVLAIVFAGTGWPEDRQTYFRVALAAVVMGVVYTVYSEWTNTAKGSWAYAREMPIVPWLNVGLTPLLQWLLIPPALLYVLRRRGA
ncbi:MAG: hypothetical protein SGJ03_12520 [Alphaproteobacteria bacterium]|nr:hypothetical protein [Alphaproteobacteria bacterium]